MEHLLYGLIFPVVPQDDTDSLGEESHLPETVLQGVKIIFCLFKNLRIRLEIHPRSGLLHRAVARDL